MKLWEVGGWKLVGGHQAQGLATRFRFLSFSPDSKILALAEDNPYNNQPPDKAIIRLWGVAEHKELRQIRTSSKTLSDLTFSPDGKSLVGLTAGYTIKLWDFESGREISSTVSRETAYVRVAAFSPDSKFLLTGHGDAAVRLWQIGG
jgi:WD40 repeat protein